MSQFARWFFASLKQSACLTAGRVAAIVVLTSTGLGWLWPLAVYAATTITVTVTTDELQQDGDCSLREAVQSVNTGQQFDRCGPRTHNDSLPAGPYLISLNTGDYSLSRTGPGENANSTGDLDLLTSVTIQGVSAALTRINGSALDRVLDIDPTDAATITVTLANLTIENGLAPGGTNETDGGGIRNQDDTLHVRDSIINDNTVQLGATVGSGGGIANTGGTVHITNTVISNNRLVNGSGGGIYNNLSGTVTISGSTISGNRASIASGFSSGGGISNINSSMDIMNSAISNNEADGFGGGISNFSSAMNIANSTITGNRTDGSGGGIRNSGALSITHVTISGNTADFDGNDTGSGGGIFSQVTNPVLKAVIISNNTDNSPQGGSITPDGYGSFSTAGYNMIGNLTSMTGITDSVNNDRVGVNPLLGTLTGSPAYFPLQASSPAIDQIPAANCTFISSSGSLLFNNGDPVTFAQNGKSRPSNGQCDIGAFEGPDILFIPFVQK